MIHTILELYIFLVDNIYWQGKATYTPDWLNFHKTEWNLIPVTFTSNSSAREASVWSCMTKSPWPGSTSNGHKQYHKRSLLLLSHWTSFDPKNNMSGCMVFLDCSSFLVSSSQGVSGPGSGDAGVAFIILRETITISSETLKEDKIEWGVFFVYCQIIIIAPNRFDNKWQNI